jgi:ABC-type sugar transport system ATPase subunit
MTMGDRIAVITDGVLQQAGPPQHVYDRPANLFVARFIGSPPMNTLSGTVVSATHGADVIVPGGVVPLRAALADAVRQRHTTAITVGVRPEHLSLSDDGPVEATVTLIESLGHERHVVCSVADGTLVIVRRDSDDPEPPVGSVVRLTATPEHVHLFDSETARRVEPIGERPS